MEDIKKQYSERILKHLSEGLSPQEEISLQEWLARNPENQHFYDKIKTAWFDSEESIAQQVEATFLIPDYNAEAAFNKVDKEITARQVLTEVVKHPKTFHLNPAKYLDFSLVKIAAIFILVFGGVLTLYLANQHPENVSMAYLNTVSGTKKSIILSDGTKVWLNAESQLYYPENFAEGKSRKVYLKGEAYFSVTKDASRPFIVMGEKWGVKVLGTEFNFHTYPEDDHVSVVVTEGKVEVGKVIDDQLQASSTILTPNQQVKIHKEDVNVRIEPVEATLASGWKDEILYFNNTPFAEVVKTLERAYNVQIHYPAHLSNCKTTLTLAAQSIEDILMDLQIKMLFDFSVHGKQVQIKGECRLKTQ